MDSEATQPSGMVNFLTWVEVNKQRLIIGTVVALAVIFVTVLVIQHQAAKELNASEALSNVRLPYSAGAPAGPGTAEELAKVASEHKGTKAAARALLISAGILFSEAKAPADYAAAQQRFAQILQEYPDSMWSPQANLGVAASLSAQGKTNEALAKYEELQRRFANSAITRDVQLGLAKLYESSKPEEAYKLYDEIQKENPQSVLSMEADLRQDILSKLHPQLVPPPPAPMMPPSAMNPNQQVTITPITNRVTTNAAGSNKPVEIKLTPSANPTPGQPNTPAPATPKP